MNTRASSCHLEPPYRPIIPFFSVANSQRMNGNLKQTCNIAFTIYNRLINRFIIIDKSSRVSAPSRKMILNYDNCQLDSEQVLNMHIEIKFSFTQKFCNKCLLVNQCSIKTFFSNITNYCYHSLTLSNQCNISEPRYYIWSFFDFSRWIETAQTP